MQACDPGMPVTLKLIVTGLIFLMISAGVHIGARIGSRQEEIAMWCAYGSGGIIVLSLLAAIWF